MSNPVRVRTMRAGEFDAMRALSVAAFSGDQRVGRLLDALRDSWAWDDSLSYIAERDGEMVGHVLYTHAMLDAQNQLQDVLVLSPIGVRPDLHGQGIGGNMMSVSLTALGSRDEPLVFLEGHPTYYPRFGFQTAADWGFVAPSARTPRAAFMVLPLPRYEPWMTGALVYPDAFWRCDAVGPPREKAQPDSETDEGRRASRWTVR